MNCREYIVVATLLVICASAVGLVTEQAAPVVAAEDLWSKPDGGIRGRLVVARGAPLNGTSQVQVYLELQNVSDVANSIHITPAHSMSFEVVDAKGNVVKPDAGMSLDVSTPDDPLGLVLPHQGTLRFLVSVTGIGVPKDKKWQVSVPHESSFRSWVIERTDGNSYFLSGIFKATAERQVGRTWAVDLSLPKVAVAPLGDEQRLGTAAWSGHGPGKSQTTQLRMSISTPHQNVDGNFTFRLALENIGVNDIVLNLGTMLANGKVHLPDAIRLILTDATGESRELHFSDRRHPFVGGRVDDYSVPLRAGSSYSIKVSLDDYWSPDTKEPRLNLPPGEYRIRAEFTGSGARYVNLDTQGMKLMNFWRGTLRSDETRFVVRKRGAACSPNVAIQIESDRSTFTVGEGITVTITIKNLTSQDLDAPETYWSARIVLDGKEFERLPQYIGMWNGPGVILRDGGHMRTLLTLSEYGISQEFLTVGEHSIRVKIGDDLSNTLVITTVGR